MRYKVDKKRVFIDDKDLEGVDQDRWKDIMRRVLGRHYSHLKDLGSGWTFPAHSLETFLSLVEKPAAVAVAAGDGYRYDIDPALKALRQHWLQTLDIKN